ncbi:MAG TPA: enoyl-CoA hydratase/isomerase family protein [Thermoplasmataceae archaeon]|nr:enoyl-CoA hydratase/isomerase family protein [Thermoplasmatales archaeon AK]HLH86062.1 enoyl-CoA hydratase/isomerase family protein [Thermoplasmataceae archaeon]
MPLQRVAEVTSARQDRIAVLEISMGTANTLDYLGLCDLRDSLMAQNGSDCDAIIITGSGERSFCMGASASCRDAGSIASFSELHTVAQEITGIMRKHTLPVIALVNGYALDFGFELALSADYIISVSGAKFGIPGIKFGFPPLTDIFTDITLNIPGWVYRESKTGSLIDAPRLNEAGVIGKILPPQGFRRNAIDYLKNLNLDIMKANKSRRKKPPYTVFRNSIFFQLYQPDCTQILGLERFRNTL